MTYSLFLNIIMLFICEDIPNMPVENKDKSNISWKEELQGEELQDEKQKVHETTHVEIVDFMLDTKIWIVIDEALPLYHLKTKNTSKQEIVKYIKDWKILSGENKEIDKLLYNALMDNLWWADDENTIYDPKCLNTIINKSGSNRKLWHIYDSQWKWKDWNLIFDEINSMQKDRSEAAKLKENIHQAMQPDSKSISGLYKFTDWVCKFLKKWYEIIEETVDSWMIIMAQSVDWVKTCIGEVVNNVKRFFKPFSDVQSSPSIINPKTGVTQCSKTAQSNWRNFWVILPNGNAKEAVYKEHIDDTHYIDSLNANGLNQSIDLNSISSEVNFADISVVSPTRNWKKYWHRAVAFRDSKWEWFVLDPYYNSGKWTKPQPLSEYKVKWKPAIIDRANLYNSPVEVLAA